MERECPNGHANVCGSPESLDNVPDSKPRENIEKHPEITGFDKTILVHRFIGCGYVIQSPDFVTLAGLIPKDAMGTYEPFYLGPDGTHYEALYDMD